MRKTFISISLLFSILVMGGGLTQESYWDIQSVSNPLISPDGTYVIFTKKFIDKKK